MSGLAPFLPELSVRAGRIASAMQFFRKALLVVAPVLALFAPAPVCSNQERYYLQGRSVSRQEYEAAMLANEGLALLRQNNNQAAVDKLSRAVRMAPQIPESHHNLGIALAKMGRINEAIEELKHSISLKADNPASWLTLGGLYQSTGQLEMAIDAYGSFLTRFPGNAQAGKIAGLVAGLKGELARGLARQGVDGTEADQAADDYYEAVVSDARLRWPLEKMPLSVFIAPGAGNRGFQQQFRDILEQSFAEWQVASGELVRFESAESEDRADIVCFWTDNPGRLDNPAEAGEARLTSDGSGISSCVIRILTVPLSSELPLTENRLKVICLHEIGHALGLAGHTSNPEDIMFFSSSLADQPRSLSSRDANTIRKLYSVPTI